MVTSYGESSGFVPVTSDELSSVNGGSLTAIGIAVAAAALAAGCAMPTNPSVVNEGATFGSESESGGGGGGGGGK